MEKILVPSGDPRAAEFIAGRDNRAKYAYHHGASLARGVLDRLLPVLSAEDAEWVNPEHRANPCERLDLFGATAAHQSNGPASTRCEECMTSSRPQAWRLSWCRETLVEGTVVVRLLERINSCAVAARRAVAPLPTVSEFANAIVGAVTDPQQDGQTIYVGGTDYLR